jgi:chemotaxis protein methyltransferase WspC
MTAIELLLRTRIGLDAALIGRVGIQRAAWARMRKLGLRKLEDYQKLLQTSRPEWNELVEAVVVTESWFFRDAEVVAAFVRLVVEEWLPVHAATPLRLLSIPCASGEEPCSLVMGLLDAGIKPDRFRVEGMDISARAVARAESGVYGKNSFRGKELSFRDRYFQPSGKEYMLAPAVRRCVRFCQANLLSEPFLPGEAAYDFIFCKNLLIYFDPPTQRLALARLERLLAPAGLLFVGPAEQPLALDHGFVSADLPLAFACRKGAKPVRRQRLTRLSKKTFTPPRLAAPLPLRPGLSIASGRSAASLTGKAPPAPRADLEMARQLADAGRYEEAAELCEAHLRQSQDSAQAYYLLGLVRDACGDASAIDCYRKALYLEPNHYESLLQMALLLQKNGDSARARTFQSRAQRVKTGTADA